MLEVPERCLARLAPTRRDDFQFCCLHLARPGLIHMPQVALNKCSHRLAKISVNLNPSTRHWHAKNRLRQARLRGANIARQTRKPPGSRTRLRKTHEKESVSRMKPEDVSHPPEAVESDERFPSGPWTGFFLQPPLVGRQWMELALTFRAGVVTGEGRDRVGEFLIRGRYEVESGQCWWSKRYLGRHDVSYMGYNEGRGIWGTWETPESPPQGRLPHLARGDGRPDKAKAGRLRGNPHRSPLQLRGRARGSGRLMNRELILASTSPYRRQLLERLGLPFRCASPDLDESTFKNLGLSPRDLAERLAQEKARAVSNRQPAAFVLGGDQLATIDGQILGKPGSFEAAVQQLTHLSGHDHALITAIALVHGEKVWTHTDETILTMRPLTEPEIRRYVKADLPLDCAGAYKLEARGITLFERIASADHSAITGLPLIALTDLLRAQGFAIP